MNEATPNGLVDQEEEEAYARLWSKVNDILRIANTRPSEWVGIPREFFPSRGVKDLPAVRAMLDIMHVPTMRERVANDLKGLGWRVQLDDGGLSVKWEHHFSNSYSVTSVHSVSQATKLTGI